MPYQKHQAKLSDAQLERFIAAATELHLACCQPLISPSGAHYRALTDLNQAVCEAIRAVTGEDPQWMRPAVSVALPKEA